MSNTILGGRNLEHMEKYRQAIEGMMLVAGWRYHKLTLF